MNYTFDEFDYVKFDSFKPITLQGLYSNDENTIKGLDYNILKVIEQESPITMNILKERLRTALNIKKISANALDIINSRIDYLELIKTNNFYDETLWPSTGVFKVNYIRRSNRQIYDIPLEEISLIAKDLNNSGLKGEALYRAVLEYFGYEVLTKKANDYLEFVENNL